ncbi:MAG: hypothetical protein CL920_33405 [Deltaproteobacteria bacterium]|nr:hypothetical protein [Deltaproteobacteria bacterium]MBU53622.1 hypothetical protein [Deltaproteobacteria bacterium]
MSLAKAFVAFCAVSLIAPHASWAAPMPFLSSQKATSKLQLRNKTLPRTKRPRKVARYRFRKVRLNVKIVYAYTQDKRSVDRRLQRDLPSLRKLFDYNVYRLLRVVKHTIPFRRALIVPISARYQVQLSPKDFNKRTQKISIRATFLKRIRHRREERPRFAAYASALIKLQNGGKVAFLGPSYQYGRILLILDAQGR